MMNARALSTILALLASFGMPCTQVRAETPYDQGKIHLSGGLSMGSTWNSDSHNYVLALRGGYFIYDGIDLGLSTALVLGNDPWMWKLSPELTYISLWFESFQPYIGTFFTRWIIPDLDLHRDSIGTRFGMMMATERAIVGLGIVYEYYLEESMDPDLYPEMFISMSF